MEIQEKARLFLYFFTFTGDRFVFKEVVYVKMIVDLEKKYQCPLKIGIFGIEFNWYI